MHSNTGWSALCSCSCPTSSELVLLLLLLPLLSLLLLLLELASDSSDPVGTSSVSAFEAPAHMFQAYTLVAIQQGSGLRFRR